MNRATKAFVVLFTILVTLAGLSLLSCRKSVDASAGADPTDLLPANNDISGFQKKGNPAIMTDEQTIFEAIDGAAGKYIDYGFVEGAQQMYSNGTVDIDVQIFNHGSEINARGIFQEFYPSSPEILPSVEAEVVIEHALLTGYVISYTRDNIFMQIKTFDKSTYALNMAKQFVWNIDLKIMS